MSLFKLDDLSKMLAGSMLLGPEISVAEIERIRLLCGIFLDGPLSSPLVPSYALGSVSLLDAPPDRGVVKDVLLGLLASSSFIRVSLEGGSLVSLRTGFDSIVVGSEGDTIGVGCVVGGMDSI